MQADSTSTKEGPHAGIDPGPAPMVLQDRDGAGYVIWDGCETVPVFCPLCGGRIGGRRSVGYRMSSIASSQALTASNHPSRDA